MAKINSTVRGKAWRLLRLALLWARKGGAFRRLLVELRLVSKLVKSLGHATPRDRIYYQERELSFDNTPIIDLKMHRPASMRFHIPCMSAPQVDFDYDFNDDDGANEYDAARRSFLKGGEEEEENGGEIISYEEEGIDEKAEEFISKFYQQMKMQRQISYLQYSETARRCTE